MKLDDKKSIRAIVRRVHPDLFSASPFERTQNSESLQVRPGLPDNERYTSTWPVIRPLPA